MPQPEVFTEVVEITLSEQDKRRLKVLAAVEGRTMRDLVRELIRSRIAAGETVLYA